MQETKGTEQVKVARAGSIQLLASKVQAYATQPLAQLTPNTMTLAVSRKSQLTLLTIVSALLIIRAARRTPKKIPLLKDLRDVASEKLDADDVTSQQLFDSQYDIIIVGGGEFPCPYLGPSADNNLSQELRAVSSPLASPRSPVFGYCWSNLVKGTVLSN